METECRLKLIILHFISSMNFSLILPLNGMSCFTFEMLVTTSSKQLFTCSIEYVLFLLPRDPALLWLSVPDHIFTRSLGFNVALFSAGLPLGCFQVKGLGVDGEWTCGMSQRGNLLTFYGLKVSSGQDSLPPCWMLAIKVVVTSPTNTSGRRKNHNKVHLEEQKIKDIQGNHEKKNAKEGGLAVPDLKLCYKAVVIKTIWYWLRDRKEDQWNRFGVSDLSKIVYEKPKDPSFGDQNPLFDKNCWENWKTVWKRLHLNQHLTPYTKINSEWVNDFDIMKQTISKLYEHRIACMSDLWESKGFKTKQGFKKITKYKINNFDYIKLKRNCTNKTNASKIRREATNWETIFITKKL
uniref:Uncharacterized protein n=2 Tax=Monodelphis domestica TaxID=13616 RepID=K7E3F2_MONDO